MDSFIKTPIKANQNQLIMGHLLEPIAAYWYQQKTGNTVYNDTNLYQHADHPWALVDFDLRFVRKEDLLSAFSKDIRPLMLNCPPCHIQQYSTLNSVAELIVLTNSAKSCFWGCLGVATITSSKRQN